MKITIVGSMKFCDKYKELKEKLEEQGNEVIIPLADKEYANKENPKKESMEDFNDNLEKSDAILVANLEDYIGINSIMEVGMAFNRNKKIFILNKIPENCKEEFEAIEVIALNGNLEKLKNA